MDLPDQHTPLTALTSPFGKEGDTWRGGTETREARRRQEGPRHGSGAPRQRRGGVGRAVPFPGKRGAGEIWRDGAGGGDLA